MKLVLNIRVLAGMGISQFVIPLDLTGPASLKIRPGDFGQGNRISILDETGQMREWFAYEIAGLYFE
jgi:hypothetical protein